MVERMMTFFKWEGVITPESLVRDINNKLLSAEKDAKKRFCFDLFDLNQDGRICVQDVYSLMDLLYDKDNTLQNDALVMTQVHRSTLTHSAPRLQEEALRGHAREESRRSAQRQCADRVCVA